MDLVSLIRGTIRQALRIVGNPIVPPVTREQAARLIFWVAGELDPSAEDARVLLAAVPSAFDLDNSAVDTLVGAVMLVAPPDDEHVIAELTCLAQHAYEEQRVVPLLALVLPLIRRRPPQLDQWAEYICRASPGTRARSRRSKLVRAWCQSGLHERWPAPAWLRDALRDDEVLIDRPIVTRAQLPALHAIQPTAMGWTILAKGADHSTPIAVRVEQFGEQVAVARSTLEMAIDRATDEAMKVTLARWLMEFWSAPTHQPG
jgi:hypothetical protein